MNVMMTGPDAPLSASWMCDAVGCTDLLRVVRVAHGVAGQRRGELALAVRVTRAGELVLRPSSWSSGWRSTPSGDAVAGTATASEPATSARAIAIRFTCIGPPGWVVGPTDPHTYDTAVRFNRRQRRRTCDSDGPHGW